ncbi:hypothetical protein GDO81_018091 [Engystomops pustulosus]|uniref:Secreted protein n=1 Tax=Engystomops pustulosus TaxID=76066 RepID=A0AAV7ABN4_ENGPU|nr:hypothetical protein GDO81_018091 [Engystomops pustulosus]
MPSCHRVFGSAFSCCTWKAALLYCLEMSATIHSLGEWKAIFMYSMTQVGDWILTDRPLFTIHKCASGQRYPSPVPFKYVPPPLPSCQR